MFRNILSIKKRWFVVAASVALLAIGLMAGGVFASGGGNGSDRDAVMDRVAEILQISRADLDGAFAQALDEEANTNFEEMVQGLVDDSTLTQDQADEANTWFDERPTNSGPLTRGLAAISDSEKVDQKLTRLVDSGTLTQDEADSLSDWHDGRPESLPAESRGRGGSRHGGGRP